MPIIETALYRDGARTGVLSLDETFASLRTDGGFAWIGLDQPTDDELQSIATQFGLHQLAMHDAVTGRQRPKLEHYDDTLFVVLRPARYLDAPEVVEFGEVHLFIGPNFVVTVQHAQMPDLPRVRERLDADPELLKLGPLAILYAVLDQVVDEYQPVMDGLENDVDEIEDQLFGGDPAVSKRVYELVAEAMAFQRASHPLLDMLATMKEQDKQPEMGIELRRRFRNVEDHVIKIVERADICRATLQNALTVQSTLVTQLQNEQMRELSTTSLEQGTQVKKVSSWAAILFVPGLIGTIYGMNFVNMPELHWPLGYPFALGLMAVTGTILYLVFKRRNWL